MSLRNRIVLRLICFLDEWGLDGIGRASLYRFYHDQVHSREGLPPHPMMENLPCPDTSSA